MKQVVVVGLGMIALVAGCEKAKKPADQSGTIAGSAAMPAGTLPPEAVAKDPAPAKTVEAPKAADSELRAPVAGDLATYLADVKGNGKLMATIETSEGTFHCELYGDKTPMTVANFVGLATGKKAWLNPKTGNTERGVPYFDGLIFHRVIPGFMIQGGDPLGQGMGGPGYTFDDEIVQDLRMKPGVLAMANAGASTNGSQFFIVEGQPDHLNGHHTIFGQCAEVALVTKITGVPRDDNDRPNTPVVIKHVTISKS